MKRRSDFKLRYVQGQRFIKPVLARCGRDLKQMRALEIGCGKGAKACALAHLFEDYLGIDLDARSIARSRANARMLGVDNARFLLLAADDLSQLLEEQEFDFIILYAVLEHMTVSERLNTLKLCWQALPDHGMLYVGEAPNRIAPIDYHSSGLPYFHQMPTELAEKFIDTSSHRSWIERVRSEDSLKLGLYRHGQHVGFQEFDLTIAPVGQLGRFVVADNWSAEMLNIYPLRWFEMRNLDDFQMLARQGLTEGTLPPIFARYWIEALLSKTPVANPITRIERVRPTGDYSSRTHTDPLNNPLVSVSHGQPMVFELDRRHRELLVGLSRKSFGTLEVSANGTTFLSRDVDDIQSINADIWGIQSWISVPVDHIPIGSRVSISSRPKGWLGCLPVLAR